MIQIGQCCGGAPILYPYVDEDTEQKLNDAAYLLGVLFSIEAAHENPVAAVGYLAHAHAIRRNLLYSGSSQS